jgi:hypothetical protein
VRAAGVGAQLLSSVIKLFSTNAYSRERMNQSKYVQEPEHDSNNHHQVQNGLDAPGHGDEAIHEPQQDANDNQDGYKVNQGHDRFASFFACTPGLTQG